MAENEREPEVYFTIRMPLSLRDKINRLARKNDRSAAAEVRRAIDAHLSAARKAL